MSSPSSSASTLFDSPASTPGKRKAASHDVEESLPPSKISKNNSVDDSIWTSSRKTLPFISIVDNAIKELFLLNKDETPHLSTWNARKAVCIVRYAFLDIASAREALASVERVNAEACSAFMHLTEWILGETSEQMRNFVGFNLDADLKDYFRHLLKIMNEEELKAVSKQWEDFLDSLYEHSEFPSYGSLLEDLVEMWGGSTDVLPFST